MKSHQNGVALAVSCFILAFCFSSCVSDSLFGGIPQGSAVLIVPTQLTIEKNPKFRDMRPILGCTFMLEDGSTFTLPPDLSGAYQAVGNLPPGRHRIIRVERFKIEKPGAKYDVKIPDDLEFTLVPGEFTVLPYQVDSRVKESAVNDNWTQYYSFVRLPENDMTAVADSVRSTKEYLSWKADSGSPNSVASAAVATLPAARPAGTLSPCISVMDFSLVDVSPAHGALFQDVMSAAMFRTGRYRIIERRQREQVLEELKFSLSGLVDEATELKIGELIAAEYLVTGSVASFPASTIVVAKLVRTETGETLSSATASFPGFDQALGGLDRVAGELKLPER